MDPFPFCQCSFIPYLMTNLLSYRIKINGASPDGRRTVHKSKSNGCFMKVINSTLQDLGNYTCSITTEIKDGDHDIGFATITVNRTINSHPKEKDEKKNVLFPEDKDEKKNDLILGVSIAVIILLVIVIVLLILFALFIFHQYKKSRKLGHEDKKTTTDKSENLMKQKNGQKTQDPNKELYASGNGSVVDHSRDLSYQVKKI